jgi:hypothetical protein
MQLEQTPAAPRFNARAAGDWKEELLFVHTADAAGFNQEDVHHE